jgi:hypothetical protein
MNCEQVLPLLDPLCDGELDSAGRAGVIEHLGKCPACAAELAAIRELGETARNYAIPQPPADLWNRIARQLPGQPLPARVGRLRFGWWAKVAAVAALLLVAIYTGWLAYVSPSRPPSPGVAPVAVVDIEQYLDTGVPLDFAGGKDLLAVAARPEDAAQQVQFRVFNGTTLPDGYGANCCMVGHCGACKLVHTGYNRGKDCCVVLQYPSGVTVGVGPRPVEVVEVNGKSVQLVQGQACWAASWQAAQTGVTILGSGDRAELLRLVAYVDHQLKGDRP